MKSREYFWKENNTELRIMDEDDLEAVHRYFDDETISSNLKHADKNPYSYNEFCEDFYIYMEEDYEDDELRFVIENEENRNIGFAIISWIDERNGNCSVELAIKKEYRNQGYASDALNILLEYCFNERRLETVQASALEGNTAAEKLLLTHGFRMEVLRREMFLLGGERVSEKYYALTAKEYCGIKLETADAEDKMSKIVQLLKRDEAKVQPRPQLEGNPLRKKYDFRFEDVQLGGMTEEIYEKCNEILYNSEDSHNFDNEIKLPDPDMGMSQYQAEHLNNAKPDNRMEFSVNNDEGEIVGNINLCGIDNTHGKFSVSYYIFPEYRGNGYAKKALRIILEYAFMILKMNKFVTVVNEDNIASLKVMLGVGCNVEGIRYEANYFGGKYNNEVYLGLLKEEYEERFQ